MKVAVKVPSAPTEMAEARIVPPGLVRYMVTVSPGVKPLPSTLTLPPGACVVGVRVIDGLCVVTVTVTYSVHVLPSSSVAAR